MSEAKKILIKHMQEDNAKMIGKINKDRIERVADAWMNDKSNSKHRFDVINDYFPNSNKLLDMASGTGTFGFYALLHGYDAYGIDPEQWKHNFLKLKAKEYNYPKEWLSKFVIGYGEFLPFEDGVFDFVSSYQTLEHVKDPSKCINEMIRVVKSGGGLILGVLIIEVHVKDIIQLHGYPFSQDF